MPFHSSVTLRPVNKLKRSFVLKTNDTRVIDPEKCFISNAILIPMFLIHRVHVVLKL